MQKGRKTIAFRFVLGASGVNQPLLLPELSPKTHPELSARQQQSSQVKSSQVKNPNRVLSVFAGRLPKGAPAKL